MKELQFVYFIVVGKGLPKIETSQEVKVEFGGESLDFICGLQTVRNMETTDESIGAKDILYRLLKKTYVPVEIFQCQSLRLLWLEQHDHLVTIVQKDDYDHLPLLPEKFAQLLVKKGRSEPIWTDAIRYLKEFLWLQRKYMPVDWDKLELKVQAVIERGRDCIPRRRREWTVTEKAIIELVQSHNHRTNK